LQVLRTEFGLVGGEVVQTAPDVRDTGCPPTFRQIP